MKIIDLLNKIANGNIPNRIIYDEYVYQWNKIIKNYERETDIDTTLNWDYIAIECLNEEVEILEEEKKIPEKLNLKLDDWTTPTQCDIKLSKKIDEIIDYLKSKGE